MGRYGARISNQDREQVLRHLANMLKPDIYYHVFSDPMGICFEVRESDWRPKPASEKLLMLQAEASTLSKKHRRLSGTRRRKRPKIRTVKRGRTVNLKGVVY
jgi:ABC-type iron transport system FetAB ATPase subunit